MGFFVRRVKAAKVNPVRHDDDLVCGEESLPCERASDGFGDGDDARSVRECSSVQPVQRKEYMARDDEASAAFSACGKGGQRVVAGHVRMDNLYPQPVRQPLELHRASHIERIAEADRENVLCGQPSELWTNRRAWRERRIDLVAARRQRVQEINQMPLAPAERPRRTDVQNSHEKN